MESKPNPFSEISKQTSQAGRAPHAAWPAQRPAPGTREVFTKYLKRAMKAESESEKKKYLELCLLKCSQILYNSFTKAV